MIDVSKTSKEYSMDHLLNPIYKILEEGNQSMKWIEKFNKGFSVESIMKTAINDMHKSE